MGRRTCCLLDVLVEVLGGATAEPLPEQTALPAQGGRHSALGGAPLAYEVMYALRGTGVDDLDALRERLSDAR